MAKAAPTPTRMVPEVRKAFHAEFRSLCGRWSSWDVWSDWLVMASCSVYNSIHRDPKVEDEYLQATRRYNADELAGMARLLGILVEGLEVETADFLGPIFHDLELHNEARGQFFTPYELCRAMARMMDPQPPRPGRILRVGELAAGSGAMLIAFHEALTEECPELQGRILYHAKDVDHRAFRMTYLQLSLLGMAAEVELGDTLRGTTDRVWRTPGYYFHNMDARLRADELLRAIPEGEADGSRDRHEDDDQRATDPSACLPDATGNLEVVAEAMAVMDGPPAPPEPKVDSSVVVMPDLILPRPGEQFAMF